MKTLRKPLAVLLTVVLTLLCAASAFAAAPEDAVPSIYVHGFMGSDILADRNDPDSKVVWGPDMNALLGDVKGALPSLVTSLALKNWERFVDKALEVLEPYFTPAFYADDGTPGNSSGVWFVYPEYVDKNSAVAFRYDWREDPMKSAADLNDFINYVCEQAGVSQVNIHAHSYGGIVLTTYLTLYGNEKVRAAAFDATAVFGEAYTGDLMTGHITIDAQALEDYLKYSFEGSEYSTLIFDLLKTARVSGLTKLLTKLGSELIDAQAERVMRELLLPMFANWLSIWAMLPDKDVDAAMHFVFDELCKDEDRSALREKVEVYNTQIRPYKAETLKALNEKANVYVLSRTGYASIPITPSHANLSDGTVDTMYSSFGATTADYGKQLPESALAGKDPAMISPEKDIDASTCLFPEQTWFLRGAKHAPHYESLDVMIGTLLSSPTQADVNTFEQYPRFLTIDPKTGSLQPAQSSAGDTNSGLAKARSIIDHLRSLFAELKLLLSLIFKK